MVAASAETLAAIAYAKDLGNLVEGEVYTDSSAALGIAQRAGIGKVRHLRTQGLWVQETRLAGRLAYKKVLGQKNPSDVLTKHVAGDLLDRHVQTMEAVFRDGRAEVAPELNSVESLVEWYVDLKGGDADIENEPNALNNKKKVMFASKVTYRAIPHENRGRKSGDRSVGHAMRRKEALSGEKLRWVDMDEGLDESAAEIFLRKCTNHM